LAERKHAPDHALARWYLVGLLDRFERKNGWQLAEAIGEMSAKGVQCC